MSPTSAKTNKTTLVHDAYLENVINNAGNICDMHIVFIDIVKYSKRNNLRQVTLIEEFAEIIWASLEDFATKKCTSLKRSKTNIIDNIIKLPTGDGFAIGIPFFWLHRLHLDLSEIVLEKIDVLNKINKCEDFDANAWCDCHNNFKVRIGLSYGTVILYKDINRNYNIAGTPINMAARVMSLGNSNQIILTQAAYDRYTQFTSPTSKKQFLFHENIQIKHGEKINIYQYTNTKHPYIDATKITDNNDAQIQIELKQDEVQENTQNHRDDFVYFKAGKYNNLLDNKAIIINCDFAFSKYLVSQKQYLEIMQENPSQNTGNEFPVENVSFLDAVAFCNKLSVKESLEEVYKIEGEQISIDSEKIGFRLPFESEWEYALNYSTDFILKNLDSIAWYNLNSGNCTQKIASEEKKPNDFGIYDMLGNVWEWCNDAYSVEKENASNELNSNIKVLRGGSYADFKSILKSGFRKKGLKIKKHKNVGIRLVLQNKQ